MGTVYVCNLQENGQKQDNWALVMFINSSIRHLQYVSILSVLGIELYPGLLKKKDALTCYWEWTILN